MFDIDSKGHICISYDPAVVRNGLRGMFCRDNVDDPRNVDCKSWLSVTPKNSIFTVFVLLDVAFSFLANFENNGDSEPR